MSRHTLTAAQAQPFVMLPTNLFPTNGTDISPNWLTWLATIPNGTEIRFQPSASYGFGDGFAASSFGGLFSEDAAFPVPAGRHDLTINGNGSTLTALTEGSVHRNYFSVCGCTNITIKNFSQITGPLSLGEPAYNAEFQSPFFIASNTNVKILNCNVNDAYGYFVQILDRNAGHNPTGAPQYPPSKNTTVDSCVFDTNNPWNAAQGIAVISADGVTVNNCQIKNPTATAIDVEPTFASELARNLTFTNNQFVNYINVGISFGGYARGGNASDGLPSTENVNISGNTFIYKSYSLNQPLAISSQDGVRMPSFTVSGNTFGQVTDSFAFPNSVHSVLGLTYTNNVQHGKLNDRNFALDLTASGGALSVTGNSIDSGQPGTLLYGAAGQSTAFSPENISGNTNWPATNNLT